MEHEVTNLFELEEFLENCRSSADQFGLAIVAVRIEEALDALNASAPRINNGATIN